MAAEDPRVQAFMSEFTADDDFNGELDDWCEKHAGPFKGARWGEEMKLEYTQLHDQYKALLEERLESFLKKNDMSSEELMEKLSEMSDKEGDAWVPAFIANCEFKIFFETMAAVASLQGDSPRADKMREQGKEGTNFSGVWQLDPSRGSTAEEIEENNKAVGMPWAFRKLAAKARTKMVVTIDHTDKLCVVTQKAPYFPAKVDRWNLDGVPVDHEPTILNKSLGWKRTVTAYMEDGKIYAKVVGNPKLTSEGLLVVAARDGDTFQQDLTFHFPDGAKTLTSYYKAA